VGLTLILLSTVACLTVAASAGAKLAVVLGA